MYRRRKNVAAPKITIIRMIQMIRGMPPSSGRVSGERILHAKTWLYILTHAWARRWSLHLRGAVLLCRGLRAPLRVEVGAGERRGHDHSRPAVPGLVHFRAARPVRAVSGDVVGAYQEQGPARGRSREGSGCRPTRAPGTRQPRPGGNRSE